MKRTDMLNKMINCYQECMNMNYSTSKAMDRVLELMEEELGVREWDEEDTYCGAV